MTEGNHNMSESACRERARIRKEHDDMLERITMLNDKTDKLFNIIMKLHKMVGVNRESIQTLTLMIKENASCLKQDS